MGKSYMAIVILFMTAILSVLLVHMEKNKRKDSKDISAQVRLGLALNVVHLCTLFSKETSILQLLYCVELIIQTWIMFYFLRYASANSKHVKIDSKEYKIVTFTFLMIDSAVLLSNAFTQWFFPINVLEWGGDVYVGAEWGIGYILQTLLFIICEANIVIIMLKKAFAIAKVYRKTYFVMCFCFVAIYIADLVLRILMKNVNIIPVTVTTLAVCGHFYMYFRLPENRVMRLKNYAINNMADPVLMFDYNDSLQVYNSSAREMLGVEDYMSFKEFVRLNALSYESKHLDNKEKVNTEFIRTTMLGRKTYLIHGQELWDEHKKFVGTLLTYMDISSQERLKDEATLYATRDTLTGLWNREYFFEIVEKTIRENTKEDFVLIVSNVHQFKLFNEILGTKAGDDLLLAIAQGYRERCKRLWVFSRITSDKFALLMPKSDFDEERFLSFCHEVFNRKSFSLKVHFCLGVYEVTDRMLSAKSMYDRAFMALECIKGDLQKEIAYYHEEILNRRIFEVTTVDEMDRALLNNEFVIFLQPQVDILTNKIVSAEALVRWDKPGRGIVGPGEFIPLFESNGMIAKLDYYVWELACKQLRAWKDQGHEERSISVNISAKDFYLTDLYECLTGLVERYEIKPKNLKLEITETAFVLDVRKQMELVRALQTYGFLIEIDDFGSGYSSLNSLKDICVDVLKMDLKFFEKTDQTNRAEKIVESVINLSNCLGMPVIAEGVETEEDLRMLKEVGCQIIQGFFLAKPMSVEDFENFIQEYEYEDIEEVLLRLNADISALKLN